MTATQHYACSTTIRDLTGKVIRHHDVDHVHVDSATGERFAAGAVEVTYPVPEGTMTFVRTPDVDAELVERYVQLINGTLVAGRKVTR